MAVLGSPFAAGGTAVSLPAQRIGYKAKLVIRIDDATPTDRIYFSLNGVDASPTNAQGFLNGGESIEISGDSIQSAASVSIVSTSGTPNVYWGVM